MMNPELPELRSTQVIAIVGTINGAGKTTTSMNLAVAFAASGHTVLLIDLDPRSGIGNSLIRGWHEDGGASRLFIDAVVTRDLIAATEIPDLYLIPSEEGLNAVEHHLSPVGDSRTRLVQSLETLRALPIHFDVVIANCPSNLGLITLNALVAAHWVLIPVASTPDNFAHSGLPALLTAIQRLRGGMKQPLRGVYLLQTQVTTENTLFSTLPSDYELMTLPLTIPWSAKVVEASQQGKPVLVYAPHDPISMAYLDLAAVWLELLNHGATTNAPPQLFFPTSTETSQIEMHRESAPLRRIMEKRIIAWLLDPSCLLYDADEAKRQPEPRVIEELIALTHQAHGSYSDSFMPTPPVQRPFVPKSRVAYWSLFTGIFGVLLPIILSLLAPPLLRFELAAWLIGRTQYWNAGSSLLFRADETAYRELIFGTKLIGNNRSQLLACGEVAQTTRTVVNCTVSIAPE